MYSLVASLDKPNDIDATCVLVPLPVSDSVFVEQTVQCIKYF